MRQRVGLFVMLLALFAIAWRRWAAVKQDDVVRSFSMAVVAQNRATLMVMSDTIQQTLIDRDPFRIARRPSSAPLDRDAASVLPATADVSTTRYRPAMTLRAIAGPPWRALLDGVPGEQRTTVVQPGSIVDRLIVRSVSRDRVVIQGPDTVWTLELGARR